MKIVRIWKRIMKIDIINIDNKKSGTIELNSSLFGLEPRSDILNKVVRWQLAKRHQGTHSTLTRSEVNYSTKKIVRQKGSGSGRHGSRRAPIFRKGGVYKGPKPRSHSFSLTKKVRKLGLCHALSAKFSKGNLVVLNKAELESSKTLNWGRTLIISSKDTPESLNFFNASKNIPKLDVLPVNGINVYDVLKRDTLVLTKAAVEALEVRLS